MMESEEWDLEKVYDEQIAPLMTQIIAICKEHKMPYAGRFQFSHEAEVSTNLNFEIVRGESPLMHPVHVAVASRHRTHHSFMTVITKTLATGEGEGES